MSMNSPSILVAGGLNTDIVGIGVPDIVGAGKLAYGGTLKITPGGKSRNMAQMIANLTGPGVVGMVGRTNKDPLGLWKAPYDALVSSGVSVDNVIVGDEPGVWPGVALIPVTGDGRNQIYVLPGANENFSPDDIEQCSSTFEKAGAQNGILALSLELPIQTALAAITKAVACGMRVVLDPGGLPDLSDPSVRKVHEALLGSGIYLLKPNEHEAQAYTGVQVTDLASARAAFESLQSMGIQSAMITHGAKGAYVFEKDRSEHIPVPSVETDTSVRDETGCGDQVTSVMCSELQSGSDLFRSASKAVLAGTLQFYRAGVSPLSAADLEKHWKE